MNYPIWQLDGAGGGLLIAAMAILHVYISHFAVGGGLFLVLTEWKGYRDGNPAVIEFVRKHTRFFLLLTMVLGAMTGVGIWFTISLVNPAATSVLIHTFVFGWATEWVFFFAEIVSLFIYYKTFGKMSRRNHLLIGWIYFACAWISLFIINGIIDFMLTPGAWIENGDFWSGFFNPTFWPALFFRTFLALIIAGLFGLMTATFMRDRQTRTALLRYSAFWMLLPAALFLGSAWWYRQALPPELQQLIFQNMPELKKYIGTFYAVAGVIIIGGLLMAVGLPRAMTRPVAIVMLVTGLLQIGAFEFIREGGRRPYIIRDYMYSTAILKKDMGAVAEQGVLTRAKWVMHKQITPENRMAAGRELFNILCLPCHSIGGPLNDIRKLSKNYTTFGMNAFLSGVGKLNNMYMPPFAGTELERETLASFIVTGLNGRLEKERAPHLAEEPVTVPAFDPEKGEYVLLAWNSLGMHCITDSSRYFTLLPPANELFAQLIRRGELPEVVTDGVTLSYRVEEGFENPATHVEFWENADQVFGSKLVKNVGLSGNGMSGAMKLHDSGAFVADMVPVVPYPDRGGYQPYPRFTIEARDSAGILLAETQVVAPVSTEMGCRNCHGGNWRIDGRAGFSDETGRNILAAHDKNSGTALLKKAESGEPVLCQSCHPDPVLNASGNPERLNMPASLHGFHATYLANRGADTCAACHPSSPEGATRCLRGIHDDIGYDCTNCHGTLEDHALSLLKSEQLAGKKRAGILMANLKPRAVSSVAEINPRIPWVNEPDCLNCHVGFMPPEISSAFNTWTSGGEALYRNRRDESGALYCAACHNSPHAVYPAFNPYGEDRDNIQPLQYQDNNLPIGSNRNCEVCHTVEMTDSVHHPNMEGMFRNQ